jgi:hypothetical protein
MCGYDKATVVRIHCDRILEVEYKLKVLCVAPDVCGQVIVLYESTSSIPCGCTHEKTDKASKPSMKWKRSKWLQ